MLFIGLFSWWYGAGWLQFIVRAFSRVNGTLGFFSVGLLLKTFFSPYRQISVGSVQGPIGAQLRAWADLQLSRLIGAMVRLSVIIFGLIATLLLLIIVLVLVVLWPLIPLLPIIALGAMVGSGP
jgi:hypothetical protein